MVIRDIVRSSVGATVSDSMLNPRAEKSPEIRDSAPDSFSTRIERIWRISMPTNKVSLGAVHLNARPAARRALSAPLGGDERSEYRGLVIVPPTGSSLS